MEAFAKIGASARVLRCPAAEVLRSRGNPPLRWNPGPRTLLRMSSSSATDENRKVTEPFFRSVITNVEKKYLRRNPTAAAILDLVRAPDSDNIVYDHFAFRTFGVDGHGIDSMAKFFIESGYTPRDELKFPSKKLTARWFSPPVTEDETSGTEIGEPLPRIFISELNVDEMSSESQEIIRKYTKTSGYGSNYATLASALGSLTWDRPLYSDYQRLLRESEYAAWTLVNGYALNHVTIPVHRLKSSLGEISAFNEFIEGNGFQLNSEGGTLKVSPDGLLRQSSTVADSLAFIFSEGISAKVPCAYIEFAERLVLPQFKDLPSEQVRAYPTHKRDDDNDNDDVIVPIVDKVEEKHRRDGFEVGNADKIFESTWNEQMKRIPA